MKKTIFIICSTFCITPGFATVYSGTYTTGININTQSTIAANTVFNNAAVSVSGSRLTIEDNVQFLNHALPTFNGAALYKYGTINIDGNNVLFDNNYFAISIENTLNINGNNTHFTNNKSAISTTDITYYTKPANNSGTKVFINGQNTLFDNNSYYSHNSETTKGGGAIFIAVGDSLTINGSGTVFSNNSASQYGGAIHNDGTITMNSAVTFDNNVAGWGGGAIVNSYYFDMYNAYTSHNANLYIAPNSQFINNSVTSGSGGAIYNLGNSSYSAYTFIGHDTLFSGNTASVNGGAIYNTGKNAVIDIDTGTTLVTFATATDSIYNNGGTINFLGTGQVNASLTSLTSVQGSSCPECSPVINLGKASADFDTVNLSDNTILKTTVYKDSNTIKAGNLSANTFNIQNDNRIKLELSVASRQTLPMGGAEITVLIDKSGLQGDGWDYFGNDTKNPYFTLENNRLYDIEFVRDGVYKITPKNFMELDPSDTEDIADNAGIVWTGSGFEPGSIAEDIANVIHLLAQFASLEQTYNQAIDMVSPNKNGVVETLLNHSANATNYAIQRRQTNDNIGFWADMNYSSLNYKNGNNYEGSLIGYKDNNYKGSVIGGIIGQDIKLTNYVNAGMAFNYNQATIKNDTRQFDISQPFGMSLYSRFSLPLNRVWLYADLIFNHNQYDITETKQVLTDFSLSPSIHTVSSEFDANNTSAQFDIGFKQNWFGFDAGIRHNNLSFGTYTDSIGQQVSGFDLNYNYATTKAYIFKNMGILTFNANVGADFMLSGDKQYKNIVVAPNMQRYYYTANLNADTIFTFGASMDIAITDNFALGIAYDGNIDGDYSNHTEKLTFNYKF